jgi:aminoglycoside/choline kinase family phosphotransferase
MPRIEHYVRKCLLHPAMADVRKWVAEHLGSLLEPKES